MGDEKDKVLEGVLWYRISDCTVQYGRLTVVKCIRVIQAAELL